jgi:homoserine dehydrogenase
VSAARNRLRGVVGPGESTHADLEVVSIGHARTSYHLAIDVDDRTGVLAAIAQVFADHGVSIRTVRQVGSGDDAQLVIVTHEALDADLAATVAAVRELDVVHDVSSVLRFEGV